VSGLPFRTVLQRRIAWTGVTLSSAQIDQLETYWDLLRRWNRAINLTALPFRDTPPSTIDRLFVEPLIAASRVADEPLSWFDFGTGGGSPAIPLKVVKPAARLVMVEVKARKCAFLREVVRKLDLSETTVTTSRIEELPAHEELAGTVDLITVRAVALAGEVGETARRLLRPEGMLLIFGPSAQPPSFPRFVSAPSTPLSFDRKSVLFALRPQIVRGQSGV